MQEKDQPIGFGGELPAHSRAKRKLDAVLRGGRKQDTQWYRLDSCTEQRDLSKIDGQRRGDGERLARRSPRLE